MFVVLFLFSGLHRRPSSSWWLPIGHQLVTILVFSDDQIESRLLWVAGGSNHTFVAESPDECARAVMGVTPLSSLFSSLFSCLLVLSLLFRLSLCFLSSPCLLSLSL